VNRKVYVSKFVDGRSQWPLACWNCELESYRGIDVCLLWVLCVVR